MVFVALAPRHGPLPQRQLRALQTSGSFWVLVSVDSKEPSGVVPTFLPGVVEIHWELHAMGRGEHLGAGVCGTSLHTARRSVVNNENLTLSAGVDVATLVGWLRALEVAGPMMLKARDATMFTAFLAVGQRSRDAPDNGR